MNKTKTSIGKDSTPHSRYFHLPLIGITACLVFLSIGSGSITLEKLWDPTYTSTDEPKMSERLQTEMLALGDVKKTMPIWIYFRDKGITSQAMLITEYENVREGLRPHCLWRRAKVRNPEAPVDSHDLPLRATYTKKMKPMVNRVRTVSRWLNAMSVEATAAQIQELEKLEFIRKLDLVVAFQRIEVHSSLSMAEDQSVRESSNLDYGQSFTQLDQIKVLPLHASGYSGQDVVVCILDTGFRKSHEIFQHSRLIAEWDFVNADNDVQQDMDDPEDYTDSHGTGTWSVLGGYNPGELIGPAFNAEIILGKTETTRFERPIEEDYWVAAIEWAESLGAEVVSSSLGYTDWYIFEDLDGETAVITIAANRASSLGIVVVNAAGNERDDPWGHIITPSDGFDVIAVGAVDRTGRLASFSSPGPTADGRIKPDVCAMGVNNWLASNNQDGTDVYRNGSGTSFATPLVAGVAALLLEVHRDWTPAQVKEALTKSADRSFSPNNDYGWGIINAELAATWNMKKGKKGPIR
ncbi:S8 family serine peptidase [Acidobacteriota bacterium]